LTGYYSSINAALPQEMSMSGYRVTRYAKTVGTTHVIIEENAGTKKWHATIFRSGLKTGGSIAMKTPGEVMDWVADLVFNQ
jgi:hypothetical protein